MINQSIYASRINLLFNYLIIYKLKYNRNNTAAPRGKKKLMFHKKYNQECYYDSYILFQITDKLNSLFIVNNKIINSIRGIGFNIIQKKTLIKDKISNFDMGF